MTRTGDVGIDDFSRPLRAEGGTRNEHQPNQQPPLVSIIIVAYRNREEVAALIDNIAPFRGSDLELVIIDGGSDDGTLELLQNRNQEIDYWMSAPDRGIYDAMNRGLDSASGEFILHLNAGDRLCAVPWETLRQHAKAKVDVVSCRVLADDEVFVPCTNIRSKIGNTWHHQGTFYRKAAHLGYDATYRVFGDFDHNQRLIKAGCVVKYDPCIVATHKGGGVSLKEARNGEIYRSVKANFGWFYLILAWLRDIRVDLRHWILEKRRSSAE
jgi:glycosyltransferase involved in cell wall biosynthesis